MHFSEKQKAVLDVLAGTRDSVLVTGVAGCGKSTIIREWMGQLDLEEQERTMLVAPTGIAALTVGGSTIHRAFGFMPNTDMEDPRISIKARSTLYPVETLVIDEVSMVRADLFGAMDIVLRSVKHKLDTPFGGVRVVMIGDFYQLPPVVRAEEERHLERHHGSRAGWVFLSPRFRDLAPKVFYLSESFRQAGDTSFTQLLNAVRDLDPAVATTINEIAKQGREAGDEIPRLCSTKTLVKMHNERGLRKLTGTKLWVEPVITGDAAKVPAEERENVLLAEGARVMLTANGAGYVNGSLGELVSFEETAQLWDGTQVQAMGVRLDKGGYVAVPRATREIIGYEVDPNEGKLKKTAIATVSQIPMALAYGWTIHKSQGQTLERACIDLGRGAFAHGQTYVALSRLTSAEGLYLSQPLTRSDLLLDPDVVAFCKQHTV